MLQITTKYKNNPACFSFPGENILKCQNYYKDYRRYKFYRIGGKMAEKRKMTTIWVSQKTKLKLDDLFQKKGDTYEVIIKRLLEAQ